MIEGKSEGKQAVSGARGADLCLNIEQKTAALLFNYEHFILAVSRFPPNPAPKTRHSTPLFGQNGLALFLHSFPAAC